MLDAVAPCEGVEFGDQSKRGWGKLEGYRIHLRLSRHKNELLILHSVEKPRECQDSVDIPQSLRTILHLQLWVASGILFPIRESICSSWQSLSNTRPRGSPHSREDQQGRAPCLVNTSVLVKDPRLITGACGMFAHLCQERFESDSTRTNVTALGEEL